jgi:hypothetical protein
MTVEGFEFPNRKIMITFPVIISKVSVGGRTIPSMTL